MKKTMGGKSFSFFVVLLVTLVGLCESRIYEKLLSTSIYAADQYTKVLKDDPTAKNLYPHTGNPDSPVWDGLTGVGGWTAGFYPGVLWQLHRLSGGEAKWADAAIAAQEALRVRENDTGTHDVGFVIMSSFGRGLDSGYGLDNATRWQDVIVQAAHSLSTRFNPKAGVLRSWSWGEPNELLVIIDNMLNLDLLFAAEEISGNKTFREIAWSHADKTIENHFRPDASTFHVVAYHEKDGSIMRKYTHQGWRDNSTWARGQAWAILGFVETYKWTLDEKYLDTAKRAAELFVKRLVASDNIPYWDFDAGDELAETGISYQPRDTSAASVAAFGLLNLFQLTRDVKYLEQSEKIVESLIDNYSSRSVQIPAISTNATVFFLENNFDTAIIYGDFYLLKYIELYFQL